MEPGFHVEWVGGMREVIACFPVYRSHVNGGVSDKDRMVVLRAIARPRSESALGRAVFDFISRYVTAERPVGPGDASINSTKAIRR
jgi:(1->4)-alpha-D-glucan 1-alpha-D-glucosylmutase